MICTKGIKQEFQSLEKQVWQWVLDEKKENNKVPTRKLIQNYALQLYKDAGHDDFKASVGWYRRWEKRYSLKDIRGTHTKPAVTSQPSQELDSSTYTDNPQDEQFCHKVDSSIENDYSKCNDGLLLENFSIETDKLISNIDMVNSPSEFFNFNDSSFDRSVDSMELCDSIRHFSETENSCIKNLITELMDDFGKYFYDTEKNSATEAAAVERLSKKSCQYDKDFKDKVIRYMTSENKRKEAAEKFNVHPNTISVWMKESQFHNLLIQSVIENHPHIVQSDHGVYGEEEFLNWLEENEKNSITVSKQAVKDKISELCTATCISVNSHWFEKYCHRYLNGKQSTKVIKIRYSDHFQKLMVNYANKTSQIKAASVFNLARKQLFNWMKNVHSKKVIKKKKADNNLLSWYNSQSSQPSSNMIRNKGKTFHNVEGTDVTCSYGWYYKWCTKNQISVKRMCDEELVKWILTAYDQNQNVSHQDVQEKALEIYQRQKETNFKASGGWLLRFCRRYMHLLRRVPPLSVELPLDCENNANNFRLNVMNLISEHKIRSDSYGAMDEIFLKLKPSGTINEATQKKPLLRSCGMHNIQGTVILSCLSNGQILPPLLVLKEKNVTNISDQCLVVYQSNGIVDNKVLSFWLEKIWFRFVNTPNLLILDSFSPHNSGTVKQKFSENDSHLAIIPNGCSSRLNPLTQILAPQFLDCIDENCKKWFDDNNYTWQIGGNSSSLDSEDIIKWVIKAHKTVSTASAEEAVRTLFQEMKLLPITNN